MNANWETIAQFFVQGEPAGQPRIKIGRRGNFPMAYTPTGGQPGTWKELLFWQARKHVPKGRFKGPVRVWIEAYFPRTQELSKPCYPAHPIEMIQKPDDDNIRKMALDVFTNLGFYVDDKQVCGGCTDKFYIGHGSYQGLGRVVGAMIRIEINRAWPYKQPTRKAAKT